MAIQEITSPPMLDETGQDVVDKLQAIANKINTNAGQIDYSNTTSQLQATKVQTAIDEVKGITDNISSSLGNLHLTETTLLPFNTYSDVGTVLNLSDSIANYDFILFRLGANTDQSTGGGSTNKFLPTAHLTYASQISLPFWQNGNIQQVTLNRESNTKFTIIFRSALGGGTIESGLRAIYGYKISS